MPFSFPRRVARSKTTRANAGVQSRPSLTPLEGRCMPAVIAWDGGPTGNGTNWLTAVNWAGDVLPGPNDDVTFGPTGINPTIELRGDTSVQGVMNGRRVRVIGSSSDNDATLTVGAGGFTNNDRFELSGESGFSSSLTVNGGALVNAATRTIAALAGAGGGRTITLTNGVSYSNLGTLSVAAFPTNIVLSGGGSLDNQGAISVVAGALFVTLGGGAQALTNSGSIDVSGGDLSINQEAGDTVTTTGTVTMAPGQVFHVAGGALNYQAGTIAGGTLRVSFGTLNLGQTVSTAAHALLFSTAAVNGPGTLTNGTGQLAIMTATFVNAPLVNQGLLDVRGTTTVNGGLTTSLGSTVRVQGTGGSGNATLEVLGGFTNNGLVELISDTTSLGVALTIDGGALVNVAGSTIAAAAGGGGNTDRILTLVNGASLNNQGTVSAGFDLMVNGVTGTSVSNSGTFVVAANRTLTLSGVTFTNLANNTLTGGIYNVTGSFRIPGPINTLAATLILNGSSPVIFTPGGAGALSNLTVVSPGASLSGSVNFTTATPFTNSGTVRVDAGFAFTVPAGFTNATNGTLSGRGTINGNVSGPGTVSPGDSPGNITVNGGITLGGPFVMDLDGPNAGSGYDTMTVMGGVTLGGPLNLRPGFTAPVGTQFRIIDNDGTDPVIGTFAGLPQGGMVTTGGQTFAVSYTGGNGNDVVLTRVAAPRVATVAVNAGQTNATQRSQVTSVAVTFDTAVTFAGAVADAFGLSRIGGATVGGFTATANVVNGVTVVTLSGFTGAETEFGSLADGLYSVLVRANRVSSGGLQLDGDGNGNGGDDYTLNGTVANGLYRLYGDVNGDGTVNAQDFGPFRNAFGTAVGQSGYLAFFDFNGDGFVNAQDFVQFRNRFGSGVP